MKRNNCYIITGGPGVGKTTLLNELRSVGFMTVDEDAREIIRHQMAVGGDGVPWGDKALYARLMLEASIRSFEERWITNNIDPILFDRGILDTICYMRMENITVQPETLELVKTYRYNQKVFVLPPWKEIYETDSERKQTWKEAIFTFEEMKETYLSFDYEVIEVPKTGLLERQEFVVEMITSDIK